MSNQIRTLVVDDNPFRQEVITAMLHSDPDIKVVGVANDGLEAIEKTKLYSPDVITMDLKMPNMDGLEATRQIMSKKPTPIIIISITIREQTKFAFKCLGLGALDFVPIISNMEKMREEIIDKVKLASRIPVVTHPRRLTKEIRELPEIKRQIWTNIEERVYKIITIAVSTGGPEALRQILSKLPEDFPVPILVVQHISEGFVRGLVEWLDEYCRIKVRLAEKGMKIIPGTVYFVPSGYHMEIEPGGFIRLISDRLGYLHHPSADVTFKSAAEIYGSHAIGIILTGMGDDGVEGIGAIKEKGGFTISQDENSSLIYGMPKVAFEKGYIDNVVSLERISDLLIWMVTGKRDYLLGRKQYGREKDIMC